MSLFALPTLTEQKFVDYISANYSGSYTVGKAFTVEDYELPFIMVKAGQFRETAPTTNVFEGSVALAVVTQIDDVEDPVAIHDATVAALYPLLANQAALLAGVNGGEAFHVHGVYIDSYNQERDDRSLMSIIELVINCQTLALPVPE